MSTLSGKSAVVTGAGTGIGRATAIRLAREGARVLLLGRRQTLLDETRAQMTGDGHEVRPCDVQRPEQIEDTARWLRDSWGYLDLLVNNAGVWRTADPIDSPLETWNEPVVTNFYGALHCCRALAPLLSRGGRIILVTSIHGERVEKGGSAYAVSKAALNQLARSLALELADRGILVNAVAPGFVDTPMSVLPDGTNELTTDRFRTTYVAGHHLPLRRAARPEEIAGAIAFLAGPDSTYITGHVLVVDGGLTITF